MHGNFLAFRTPISGVQISGNGVGDVTSNFPLGINVSFYPKIRVVFANRCTSDTMVDFSIFINHGPLGGFTELDTIGLNPCEAATKTYDIPGEGITISISNVTTGFNTVDVYVFGFIPYQYAVDPNNCVPLSMYHIDLPALGV